MPDPIAPRTSPDLTGGTREVITYDNFESGYGYFDATDNGISSGDVR
jgi:hypothetical protein